MSWSCSSQAHSTLNIIQSMCISQTGFQNVWVKDGTKYMYETSRTEHNDGRITGTIYRYIGDDRIVKAGRFNIGANGRIHIFNHCPLEHRNWKERFEHLKAIIFGKSSFVELEDSAVQQEYEFYIGEAMRLKQLGEWDSFGVSN